MEILDEQDTRQNPFPGLRPFRTAEAHLFFGREGQAEDLIQRLMRTHFLGVLGNSGGGKSSLVRAGLIPALHAGRRQQRVSDWKIVICRPGASPLENLAAALAGANKSNTDRDVIGPEVSRLMPVLRESSFGLLEAEEGAGEYDKTLLIVDQFEELFRFGAEISPGDAAHFVDLLITAVKQRDTHIYVVITMRSEFLGECVRYRGLPEIINEGQYLVPRLTGENVRRAVAGPLGVVGAPLDGALANRLVREVGDNMDQLPILQHALMRTYRHWQTHATAEPISHADYEAVGGMEGALGNHADELLDSLGDEQKNIARLIFQRITDLSTGDKGGRAPARMEEIYGICESVNADREKVNGVIDRFRQMDTSFLMPPPGVRLEDDSMLDISHESLIRNWKNLNDWAKKEAEKARLYGRLHQDRQYKDDGQLDWLSGALLQTLVEWKNSNPVNYWWACRYHPDLQSVREPEQHREVFERNMAFLEGSEKEEKLQADLRDKAIAEEERQKQRTRYRTIIATLTSLAAVLGILLAVYAYSERNAAEAARVEAVSQGVRADSSARIAITEKVRADSSAQLALAQKAIAEQKTVEAENNLQRAKYEELRAKAALDQVRKEKAATEEQRLRAEDNYRIAQAKTAEAESAKEEAEINLENVRKSNETVVRAYLQNAKENWQDGRYREAYSKIVLADTLGLLSSEVVDAYMDNITACLANAPDYALALESVSRANQTGALTRDRMYGVYLDMADNSVLNLHYDTALISIRLALSHGAPENRCATMYLDLSYWYCEVDSLDKSLSLLDSAYKLSGRELSVSGVADTVFLHRSMSELSGSRYSMLRARYYPVMVEVPGGSFDMGSPKSDKLSSDDERPVHRVTLSSFMLSATEVTVFQYSLYCSLTNRDIRENIVWPNSGDHPVVNVSWYDAVSYSNWLSERMGRVKQYSGEETIVVNPGSNGYRLPTESEWEYAAGNGSRHTLYSWGNGKPSGSRGGNVADETAREKNPDWPVFEGYRDGYVYTAPVGRFEPNDFGLYDMSGNVWEWCWDWYDYYDDEASTNPQGAEKGGNRVDRGGSGRNEPQYCRAAYRDSGGPTYRDGNLGFRLASPLQ